MLDSLLYCWLSHNAILRGNQGATCSCKTINTEIVAKNIQSFENHFGFSVVMQSSAASTDIASFHVSTKGLSALILIH